MGEQAGANGSKLGGRYRVALAVVVAVAASLLAGPVAARAAAGSGSGSAGVAGGAAGTGAAGAADKEEAKAAVDEVVNEVARMLQAKVSERVIVHWLETSGRRPASVGSREILELQRAGASDPLMDRLLDLAAQARNATAEAAAGQPAAPSPGGASTAPASPAASAPPVPASPAPSAAPSPPRPAVPATVAASAAPASSSPESPPMASPATAAATGASGGTGAGAERAASFHWIIAYRPHFEADDERWDLYVYLDGRYLAWIKSPLVSFVDPPLEFERSLAPGRHVLRVVEERHLRKFGRAGWTHEARVAPVALVFEAAPAAAGRVELRCETRPRGGPLRLRVTQGDAEAAAAFAEPAVGQPDSWPALCDDLAGKAGAAGALPAAGKGDDPSSRQAARPARRGLASCLRWADLWPGVPAPPSRDAVRADLERRGFRPDPARTAE
jgi:hypothetical protein